MNHCGTRELETERLILRRFTLDDAPFMHKNWASDPEVTKYLTWPCHESVEASRCVLESWMPCYENDNYYNWAIVLKELGEPIGSIAVVEQKEDTSMVHIGYCIGRKWWHQGITSEAFAAVIKYLFEEVGVNRLEARHNVNNPNSGRVMKKCGNLVIYTISAFFNNISDLNKMIYTWLRSLKITSNYVLLAIHIYVVNMID